MRACFAALLVLLSVTGLVGAQDYIIPPLEEGAIKADFKTMGDQKVRVLTVHFKVLRKADKEPATEVEESWIRVYENDKLVKQVKLLKKPKDLGLNVVLVLDVSGSMKDKASDEDVKSKIEALHEAASAFIKRLPPRSRVTLLPFSDTVNMPAPFSSDTSHLEDAIRKLQPRGGTLLYDAIYAGIETLVADRRTGRRAIIVLTDGKDEDPGSRHAPSEVIDLAREARVPLYLLGLGREHEINEPVMRDLAKSTNGTYNRAQDQKQLLKLFSDLANEFQEEEFVIEFPSLQQKQDGTARAIRIEIWKEGQKASNATQGKDVVRGVVLPELDSWVYLPLLAGLMGLLVLPYGLSRLTKSSPAAPS